MPLRPFLIPRFLSLSRTLYWIGLDDFKGGKISRLLRQAERDQNWVLATRYWERRQFILEPAIVELLVALQMSDLTADGQQYLDEEDRFLGNPEPIPRSFWLHADVDWHHDSASILGVEYVQIRLKSAEVLRIWQPRPDQRYAPHPLDFPGVEGAQLREAAPTSAKKRIGAPRKHAEAYDKIDHVLAKVLETKGPQAFVTVAGMKELLRAELEASLLETIPSTTLNSHLESWARDHGLELRGRSSSR